MSHKERRINTLELPVRLGNALLPEAQKFYDYITTETQQLKYEAGLHSVHRMAGMIEKKFPIPKNFRESNLEHTFSACEMAKEYSGKPHLAKQVRFPVVQILLGMHDAGEMAEKIGDVQPTGRTRRDEARKRLEPIAAKKAIFTQIPDPKKRELAVRFYERYQLNNPEDIDVQMARFIDKAQGTSRVAHLAFNVENVTNETVLNRIRLHLWETVPRMMEPALNLLVVLPTQGAREDMRDIIKGELELLAKFGPPEVARSFMRGIAA